MKIDLSGKDGLEERWLPISDDSPKYFVAWPAEHIILNLNIPEEIDIELKI